MRSPLPLARPAVLLAALSLAGCAATSPHRQGETIALRQWQGVASSSPLVAAAYMQSLIALTEDGPEAAVAREEAFALARECGLLTVRRQRPACGSCDPPAGEEDRPRYLSCLARRLNCLAPP